MVSKLFRAIVGVGISMGAVSACGAAVSEEPNVQAEPTQNPAQHGQEDAPTGRADGAATNPLSDGGVGDADVSTDASTDAFLDPFCDAAWPTTKGNASPTCGPTEGCQDAGHSPSCAKVNEQGRCTSASQTPPVYCVGGDWVCSSGSIPTSQCTCWEGQACP